MSNKEHRRLLIAANAVTPDADFADLQTAPLAGTDLAAGEIVELSPRHSKLSTYFVVMDGMADNAAPVANQGTAEVAMEVVTRHVNRNGATIIERGSSTASALATRRQFEGEVPAQGLSTIRVTSAGANLPAAGALWFYASENQS